MIDQRKRIFAVNLWAFDLLLTTASFFLAYGFRLSAFVAYVMSLLQLEGHTVMDVGVYLWILAIILPTWAVLLPAFHVYAEPSGPAIGQVVQLSKAIGFAGLVMAAVLAFIKREDTNRAMVLLTLVINYAFLVS